MSKKMAPGMCSARYSARASLPSLGMCQEASMITRSGASSLAPSSSVSVSHDFEGSLIRNPNLDEDGWRYRLAMVEPSGNRQTLLTQECRVEQPALVAGAVIAKHRDNRVAGAEVARKSDGACHIDTTCSAEAQPFLGQEVKYDRQRLGIWDLIGLVDHRTFEIGGDAALTDPFGNRASFRFEPSVLIIIVEGRAHRIGDADGDIFVPRLEPHGNAGERAAGAHGADEAVHLALRIVPDLDRGGLDMTQAVGDIVVLVGPDGAMRGGRGKLLGEPAGIFHVVVRILVRDRGNLDQL